MQTFREHFEASLEIIEENILMGTWILPNGEIVHPSEVGIQQHIKYVQKHPEKFGIRELTGHAMDLKAQAIENGALRVELVGGPSGKRLEVWGKPEARIKNKAQIEQLAKAYKLHNYEFMDDANFDISIYPVSGTVKANQPAPRKNFMKTLKKRGVV